jgi:hypothetical protein
MGWNASLTTASKLGDSIVLTPDTSAEVGYTVASFTAPRKGIYQFILTGSGGTNGSTNADQWGNNGTALVAGGNGGRTVGYLLLEKNQTVYCGCGGTCAAAFVSGANGASLSAISSGNLFFVAGGGGATGKAYQGANEARSVYQGGLGGGTSGTAGASGGSAWLGSNYAGGGAGTQSGAGQPNGMSGGSRGSAGSYGTGGSGGYATVNYQNVYAWGGRGGDGYYGGAGGMAVATHNSSEGFTQSHGWGGGGGSGYLKNATLTHLNKTYTGETVQGAGAAGGVTGMVQVVYYARGLLPVWFDGTQLERIFFNGNELEGLTYNGTLIYMRRLVRCFKSMAARFASRAATRASFRSALMA